MKLYGDQCETLRESPLFSTTNKEKVYKILQRKKGSIPNCNNISIVNIELIRFILLLQNIQTLPTFHYESVLELLLSISLLMYLAVFRFSL